MKEKTDIGNKFEKLHKEIHESGHILTAYYYKDILEIKKASIMKNGIYEGVVDCFLKKEEKGSKAYLVFLFSGMEADKMFQNFENEKILLRGKYDLKMASNEIKKIITRNLFQEMYTENDSQDKKEEIFLNFAKEQSKKILCQYQSFIVPMAKKLKKKKNHEW